jgi:hypothetical protein
LAGAYNSRVKAAQNQQDVQVQIPDYYIYAANPPPKPATAGQPVSFAPQPTHPILVSGERRAAQEAREALEREVERLRRELTVQATSIEKGRHQFIVGDRGVPHHEFLEETGCSVVLPPDHDEDEFVYIIGPASKVQGGESKAWDLAQQMTMTSVDIGRQHRNPPAGHSWAVAQYLRERNAIADLEAKHGASFVLPSSTQAPALWEIYTKDSRASRDARQDIINLITAQTPDRWSGMMLNPFYFQHLRTNVAPQIRKDHGVTLVIPNEATDEGIFLVYEDTCDPRNYNLPTGTPSKTEISAFQQALEQAKNDIDRLINPRQDISTQDVEAEAK